MKSDNRAPQGVPFLNLPEKNSYRIGEVALELGVHFSTIRRWTDEGRLPCIRLGTQRRIPREGLERFVRQHRA
jgi:excisionase family DNA binding protein